MQTEVLDNPALGSPGDLGDLGDTDIVSAANTEATDSIVVGTMVKLGAAADTALKLTDSHEEPYGIVTRAHAQSTPEQIESLEVDTDVFFDAIKPETMMGIGRSGRFKVLLEESVAFDDPVHVRADADAGEVAGAFGKTDGGADTIALPNCRYCGDYEVDDTGFGVGVVELNPGFGALAVTDS